MTKTNYYVLAYSLLAIIIVFATLNFLYRSERIFASIIVLILFILIFVFFGLRWFKTGVTVTGTYEGNWPPVVNSCPDYLTLYKKPDREYTCIDIIGVSSNKKVNQWVNGLTPPTATSDPHYFNFVHKPSDTLQRMNTLKEAADNSGLTWEGITDGNYTLWDLTSDPVATPKCTP